MQNRPYQWQNIKIWTEDNEEMRLQDQAYWFRNNICLHLVLFMDSCLVEINKIHTISGSHLFYSTCIFVHGLKKKCLSFALGCRMYYVFTVYFEPCCPIKLVNRLICFDAKQVIAQDALYRQDMHSVLNRYFWLQILLWIFSSTIFQKGNL